MPYRRIRCDLGGDMHMGIKERDILMPSNIPQADNLDIVSNVILAVGKGATTDDDLANVPGYVDRQGRYYRDAAEQLGFVTNTGNNASLTPLGQSYCDTPGMRQQMMSRAVKNVSAIDHVVRNLSGRTVTRDQIAQELAAFDKAKLNSTHSRRASTVSSWLKNIGAARSVGHNLQIF